MVEVLQRWSARLQELRSRTADGDAAQVDATSLMQKSPSIPWRPDLWRDLLAQLREHADGIRGVVARQLLRWLCQKLDGCAPRVVTLGALLVDIEKEEILKFACTDAERQQALNLASAMTELLDQADTEVELAMTQDNQRTANAMRDLARDFALRSDRANLDEQVPINDSWGMELDNEEFQVGIALTRWIRARLLDDPQQRQDML